MPHDPKTLQPIVAAAAPPDLDITFRAMFGGIMAYVEGKPFASLSEVGLALKMASADRTLLLAQAGSKALQYDTTQPESKTYVVVPETMLTDTVALRGWIIRSVAGLPAAKPKKKKT